MGADDYVVKRSLPATVAASSGAAAHHRQATEVRGAKLAHAVIDFERREIRWTQTAQRPLRNRNRAAALPRGEQATRRLTRRDSYAAVGITPQHLETRTIDMHIARLRTKLRDRAAATPRRS